MSDNEIIKEEEEILALMQSILNTRRPICVWQTRTMDESERKSKDAIIHKLDPIKRTIRMGPVSGFEFKFERDREIFGYSFEKHFVFKTDIKQVEGDMMVVIVPEYITMVSGDFGRIVKRAEIENEEKFLETREAPRAKIAGNKMVGIQINKRDLDPEKQYRLYDMSQGGMAFIIDNDEEYAKGDEVIVGTLAGQPMEPPMCGDVMSIRKVDENEDNFDHKVGVKFSGPYVPQKSTVKDEILV